MKLFQVKTNLTSYYYPIVKILIGLLMIFLAIMRNRIFSFSRPWINIIISVLCGVLTLIIVLVIYISIAELCYAYSNRNNIGYEFNESLEKIKNLSIDEIIHLAVTNDIIEMEMCFDNKIIKIGSSSDCKYSSSVFTDKSFYISDSTYDTVESFRESLMDFFPNGIVPIIKIDGLFLK